MFAKLKSQFKAIYSHFMGDSLRRSSSFLILSSGTAAVVGFVFWLVCARLTNSVQVGYATSLLSYIGLIGTITALGMSNAVIRFLPTHKKMDAYFSTILLITLLSALVLGAPLVGLISKFSPDLTFAITNPTIFGLLLFILVISNVGSIADAALLGHKDAKTVFIRTLFLYSPRTILPFLVAGLALQSILMIYAATALLGVMYELYVLYKRYHKRHTISMMSLSGSYRFMLGNYTGSIFGILPSTLVPIIVFNRLGPSLAAFFYIAMQFARLPSIIASSSAQAFLSEASNDRNPQEYKRHLTNTIKHMYTLLVPASVFIGLIGSQMLRVYGDAYYTNGALLLVILAASSLFIGVNWIGDSLLNVQKRPFAYSMMNLVNAALVIGITYIATGNGLVAVGIGWLLAQALTMVIYVALQFDFIRNYRSNTSS